MATLDELRRRYSFGPIPQWELDQLNAGAAPKPIPAEEPPKKRGRPKKPEAEVSAAPEPQPAEVDEFDEIPDDAEPTE